MLKEYTRPETTRIDDNKNIFSILEERAGRTPDDSLVEFKNGEGAWQSFSAEEFEKLVISLAKGLIAKGVRKGDSIAIMSHTRWEWTALDMAIMSIGALTVPVYETNSAAQVKAIFNDAQVRMAFVENDAQRDKVESVRDQAAYLGDVYVIDLDALDTLAEFGRTIADDEFWNRENAVQGDDLATIVYTSGSTGTPKGIELTHGNFVFITYSGCHSMPDICMKPDRRLLLFLPLAHVFARYMQFFCFASNVTLGLSSDLKTIIQDFQVFKPTFVLAVPRIFEKIYNAASQKAGAGVKGRLFYDAATTARLWSRYQQSDERMPLTVRLKHLFYEKLIYRSIMEVFGGHVEYAVSGGAPLDGQIAHFFNGVGLPLLEGYGMTETCAPACVNPTTGYRIGTIGLPMQGVSFGVAEDGELCIRSRAVCRGYHNHPEITTQQIVKGWLHTGDLGDIDSDGFVTITGRKKDLIITAGGKNVSPGVLEASVMTSPVVDQCLVIGDRRPFIAALITIDLADANAWLRSQGGQEVDSLEEASHNPIIATEVERAVDAANALVSRAESIRKFEILDDDFTEENGMLTPSMKTKRAVIEERYADLINDVIYVPRRR
ncbi:AMP-dependent synthetase/ligase [Bifidobacterium simiarum]|uniref:Acyl-CoA synthetase n=1 Tax=Bifidobacterium simiarum TaxID=2045441 RepID=A0A2M9HHI5_9BIFI|nr:AMP-dependent synthetase/ligase [Bifidobacterium simiarum]MBT1166800.1 AMP-binding protein [Bifidobacterium simiarum]PJM76280.1 long-chain fatty acid--CoA ligase [Bifidobacterium simiarum]